MVNLYEEQIFHILKWAQECAPDATFKSNLNLDFRRKINFGFRILSLLILFDYIEGGIGVECS